MASLGDLVVNLKANISNYNRGMGKAQTRTQKFARAARTVLGGALTVGLAAAAAGVATIRANLVSLDKMAKTSAKLGLLPENLAGLQIAFERTGVPIESGTMALQRMTRRLSEAAKGSGTAVKALDELGLSATVLATMTPDQQLARIADAMQNVTNQADKVRLAFALFDSEGVGLVNTLKDGSAGLAAFQKEAERAGLAFSAEELGRIEEANDAIGNLNSKFSALGTTLTVEAAPGINAFANALGDLMKVHRVIKGDDIADVENMFGFGQTMNNALGGGGLQGGLDNILAAGKKKREAKEAAERAAQSQRIAAPGEGFFGGMRERIAGSRQLVRLEQNLLKAKLAVQAADEKAKKAAEAQKQLDQIRVDDAIAAARDRVNETKPKSGGARLAGIATRGSSEALSTIFASRAAKVPEQALAEHRKANKTLNDLLAEQKKNQTDALLLQGAV